MKIITKSEQETYNFAKKFAKTLKGGEVIGLVGELGAGKTVFVKGLAAGLGVKDIVNSPTFVLMKVYDTKKRTSQIKKLVHVDAYRIKLSKKISGIGLEDYINEKNVIVIEWPENINIKTNKLITLKVKNKSQRMLEIR